MTYKFRWGDRSENITRWNLTHVSVVTIDNRAVWIKVGADYYRAKRGAAVTVKRDYVRLGNRVFWQFMADYTHDWPITRHEFALTATETKRLRDYLNSSCYVIYRTAHDEDTQKVGAA